MDLVDGGRGGSGRSGFYVFPLAQEKRSGHRRIMNDRLRCPSFFNTGQRNPFKKTSEILKYSVVYPAQKEEDDHEDKGNDGRVARRGSAFRLFLPPWGTSGVGKTASVQQVALH